MVVDDPGQRREFAETVARTLSEKGYQALWAGGCVRDLTRGRQPGDYDIATNAEPAQVRKVFGSRRTFEVGEAFGVVLVRGEYGTPPVEVATFRTEGPYGDGRHPDHVEFATARQDAQRRDFTINGMFMVPETGEVIDHVGGLADLEAGVVRAIGNPADRIGEDKLRMLRAIRFAASLGFSLDPETAEAVRDYAAEIGVVSVERIAGEWRRMLAHKSRGTAVRLARELGLLGEVFPELASGLEHDDGERACRRVEALGEEAGFPLALAALLLECPEAWAACRRLKLSNLETDTVHWLVEHRGALDAAATQPRSRLKPLLAHPLAEDLLELLEGTGEASGVPVADVTWCREFLASTPREELDPPRLVDGEDLVRAGLSPGPTFKRLLDRVRDAQLDGELRTREEALALIEELRETDG